VSTVKTSFKALLTLLLLHDLSSATNLGDHVVYLQHTSVSLSLPPRTRQISGSGICININCSVVVTAYHTQMMAGKRNLGAVSVRTKKVLSLANSSDTNKAEIPASTGETLSYNLANDVSFVYTTKPVPHKSGARYSYKTFVGETITIAGYENHKVESQKGHIIGLNVPISLGSAHLNENLVLDIHSKPGASGSAVIDGQGNVIGMVTLSGHIKTATGDLPVTVALPLRTVAKALVLLDPDMGSMVFSNIPEEESTPAQMPAVLYQESDVPVDTSPIIEALSAVPAALPDAVGKLQARAEATSALTVNFIAKQCLVQGTSKPVCHELSINDGEQTFRKIEKDGKLGPAQKDFPKQQYGVWMESDWADTFGEIADNPWVFQGVMGDRYLFAAQATVADDRCRYREYSIGTPLFGGGHPEWKGPVACFEEVLTDKAFNVQVAFVEMYPGDDCVAQFIQTAIYYDWIKIEGATAPVLMPVKERIIAKLQGQKNLRYASVSWTGYKRFSAFHKIHF